MMHSMKPIGRVLRRPDRDVFRILIRKLWTFGVGKKPAQVVNEFSGWNFWIENLWSNVRSNQLFFLISIDEIPSYVTTTQWCVAVCRRHKDSEYYSLSGGCARISIWYDENDQTFNQSKCFVISITLGDHVIERKGEILDLGALLDKKFALWWHNRANYDQGKANDGFHQEKL